MAEAVSASGVLAPLVLWLDDPTAGDPRLVGGKAAQLSRLAGFHETPAGFCVTTASHAAHLRGDAIPPEVAATVVSAYEELARRSGFDPNAGPAEALPVAVRSSGLAEDGISASFAGQHATHLNVRGPKELLTAIESVWRSARSEVALSYRRDQGLAAAPDAFAVLVQRFVDGDASGVAFSVDPVTGDDQRMIISAGWGLGESLVAGSINPDRWVVDKETMSVQQRALGDKEFMTITTCTGTREVRTPAYLRHRFSLDEQQVLDIAKLARNLEARLTYPVDVEFAIEAGRTVLLQCRPITTLAVAAGTEGTS